MPPLSEILYGAGVLGLFLLIMVAGGILGGAILYALTAIGRAAHPWRIVVPFIMILVLVLYVILEVLVVQAGLLGLAIALIAIAAVALAIVARGRVIAVLRGRRWGA